ncbi:hypothetical protein TrLO_g35 [Triparma laevis f. longispina]|uniref:Uncharacterized protein n=1 Tax=Triparma laevis f. longispina TaxID=1714387 RepID=A0A9W7F435_9STRA|nr:hypothetical protein TrLO_g35 [Triparma laevis f. longispina]
MSTRHINALRADAQKHALSNDEEKSSSESEVEQRVDWTGLCDDDPSSSSESEPEPTTRPLHVKEQQNDEPEDSEEEDLDALLQPYINSSTSLPNPSTSNPSTSLLFHPPPILNLNLPPLPKPYSPTYLPHFKSPPTSLTLPIPTPTLEQQLTYLYYHPTSLPTISNLLKTTESIIHFNLPRVLLSIRYLCYLDRRFDSVQKDTEIFEIAIRNLILDAEYNSEEIEDILSWCLLERNITIKPESHVNVDREIIRARDLDYYESTEEVLKCINSEPKYWTGSRDSESINFDKYIKNVGKQFKEQEKIMRKRKDIEIKDKEILERPLMYIFFWEAFKPYRDWKGAILGFMFCVSLVDIINKIIF